MHSVFYGKLAERLQRKQGDVMEQICGGAPQDFPSYRYLVGYLDAIKEVLYQAGEVDKDTIGVRPGGSIANSPAND